MTKHTIQNVGGEVIRENETYIVQDNVALNNLILSSTLLYPGKSTSGHSHSGQEEVYIFHRGEGQMQIDDDTFDIESGDVVQIPAGAFHRVFNTDDSLELYFICVFEGRRTV